MRPLSSSSRIARSLLVAALVAWGASSTVRSADIVKDNNSTGIANASSWVGGALPTPTDTIVFNDVLVQTASFGTGAALTVYGLRVEGTLTNLVNISNTANANFLELREGGLTLAGGLRSLTVAGLKADVNQTWNLGANTLTVGGSRLQGAGTVSVIGTGELIVGANNIMTKGFDITGVRLTASVANSLSNQPNVVHTIHATGQAYLNGPGITYVRGFNLAGNGWTGDATPLGALRLENGAIASGNISLIGDTRITAYQSTGTLSGNITESGGARALELGVTNDTGVLTLAGTVNLTGGTTVRGGTVRLGVNDVFADTNALTINGGTLDLAGASDTISTLTITSGTLANTGAAAVLSATTLEVHSGTIAATLGGGRLTKTTLGTTTVTAVQAYTGGTQIDSGVLALDGTDLLVPTGEVLINGGTLDISGHNNHVGALTLTSGSIINSGGAAALTAASYEVHSGQVDAVLAGVGITLVKNTVGTVTLTGANTYTGLTSVNAGTLNVTTLHAGGGAFTVGSQGTLGVALSTAGGSLVASTLTLEGGALSFDVGTFPNPGAGFPILDVGTFTLGAASTINLSGSALALGQFSLLSYDTFNGNFADLLLGTLPARTLAELVNNTGAKTIDINITGVDVPRWTGLAGNAWDVNSTQNWRLVSAGTTTTYLEGLGGTDSVLFDETATSTTVQLTTAVSPISTTVDNT
ncbi:MAG: autotransporter-associated beta strand repeat-containing protein, partial [Verrucomicrobium sp.]